MTPEEQTLTDERKRNSDQLTESAKNAGFSLKFPFSSRKCWGLKVKGVAQCFSSLSADSSTMKTAVSCEVTVRVVVL